MYHHEDRISQRPAKQFRPAVQMAGPGETIEIVKRGKPFANLVPKSGGKPRALLGATPSPYRLPADIDDPVDAEWKAMK